jgi:site-specific DNA recombinase
MATKIRAAIYTRVSSTGQGDNYSLPTQEAACRAFAADRGWDISGVYTDVHTRTELWERTQLSALREAVRHRETDAVICYAIDRLSGDPVHLGVILTEADHAGVEVVFVTEPLDDSPEGQLIRFVRGYAAKVEHEKIKERTQRGKRARIESGKPAVGPRPPFGYRWVDDRDQDGKPVKLRLEENPDTAWVVRRIFAELAGGTSARQVGLRLSAGGVPTPTGKAQWVTSTITQMVLNPIYAGDARAGRYHRERVKGQGGKGWRYTRLDVSTALPLHGIAPALVSSELAAAVVARLAVNKQESIRNNRHPEAALLRGGYGVCGYCGGHLQAITHRTNGTFYRCNQTNRDAHGCPGFSMQAHLLDAEIWQGVKERLLDRRLIASEINRLKSEDPVVDDLAALERRTTEVSRRQRNLMASLAKEDNLDVAAMIRAELATLLSEQRAIDAESAALERQRQSWRLAQEHLHELDRWIRTVATNLDTLDYSGKRLALNACQVQVRVWATVQSPRWQATMQLGSAIPMTFVDTTSRGCTRCSRWRSHGE